MLAVELAIAHYARAQHGCVTRAQLLEAGLSRATIYRWEQSGRLISAGLRTYRLASAVPTIHSQVVAGCLDRGAVASHRTALWLLGLWEPPQEIEVTVAKGRSVSLAAPSPGLLPVRIHATTSLPADDLIEVDGIVCTGVARSLLGLAALVPKEATMAVLRDTVAVAIESDRASMEWLRWMLDERRCRGRNGVAALEAALDGRDEVGPTESWLERRFLWIVDGTALPRPELQRRVARGVGSPARVDFLYAEARVVIEVLGYAFHRTPEQISADTMRANDLQIQGFVVLQVTARTLSRDPARVLTQISAALGRPDSLASAS